MPSKQVTQANKIQIEMYLVQSSTRGSFRNQLRGGEVEFVLFQGRHNFHTGLRWERRWASITKTTIRAAINFHLNYSLFNFALFC